MKPEKTEFREKLYAIVAPDHKILVRRDELLKKLQASISPRCFGEFAAFRRAMQENVSAVFLGADHDPSLQKEARQKALEKIAALHLQDKWPSIIFDDFIYALDWQDTIEESPPSLEENQKAEEAESTPPTETEAAATAAEDASIDENSSNPESNTAETVPLPVECEQEKETTLIETDEKTEIQQLKAAEEETRCKEEEQRREEERKEAEKKEQDALWQQREDEARKKAAAVADSVQESFHAVQAAGSDLAVRFGRWFNEKRQDLEQRMSEHHDKENGNEPSNAAPIMTAWRCACGKENKIDNKFCVACGQKRPSDNRSDDHWLCRCGKPNGGNNKFCTACGSRRPQ